MEVINKVHILNINSRKLVYFHFFEKLKEAYIAVELISEFDSKVLKKNKIEFKRFVKHINGKIDDYEKFDAVVCWYCDTENERSLIRATIARVCKIYGFSK